MKFDQAVLLQQSVRLPYSTASAGGLIDMYRERWSDATIEHNLPPIIPLILAKHKAKKLLRSPRLLHQARAANDKDTGQTQHSDRVINVPIGADCASKVRTALIAH